jgi:hypothetical protein
VKTVLPVIVAGSAFAAAAIVGLLCGVLVAERRGEPLFAPLGLIAGALVGGYSAVRVLLKAMQ